MVYLIITMKVTDAAINYLEINFSFHSSVIVLEPAEIASIAPL